MHCIDNRAAILQYAYVDAVARYEHLALLTGREALEIGNARTIFRVKCDPRGILSNRNDARREALAHAANDAATVEWARTLRIDAPASDAVHTRVREAFGHDGLRVRFGAGNAFSRTYVLLEGPEGVDPSDVQMRLPDARWYDEAIIALAIEPAPLDALPYLARALGGPGAPAGVCGAETAENELIVEFRPSVTQPATIVRIADVELQRFHGYRRTRLLTPLPADVVAQIAADGLQASEIAPDRMLEALLGAAHVE
jgi:hypothetical protein